MILENYIHFLDHIFRKLDELNIEVNGYELDHIGYQAESGEDYDNLKTQAQKIAALVDEKMVNGRRVGIFKFNQPLIYKHYSIPAMEIVAPKKDQKCPSALEHAEFVLDENFTDFMAKHPKLDWDASQVDHPEFPMVKLQLDKNIQVKFHYQPVLEIVQR